MAGGAVIGALRVIIGADTIALDKGLKDAQSSLSNFGAGLGKVGALAAGVFAGLAGGLGVVVKKAINDADHLNDLSKSVGLSVEELSKLKFAAELSGLSLEDLGTSLVKLSKNMAEAARDPASQMALSFKTIGVSVKNADGTLKNASQGVSDIAAKMATYKDGAEKTALAVQFFGKAGAAMIPLLNEGASGIASMKKEAEALGIVISTETAKSADEFNDNLHKLSATKNGIVLLITAKMLPALQGLSAQFLEGVKNSNSMQTASQGLIFVFKSLATAALGAWASIQATSSVIAGVIAASILAAQGQFTAALEALKLGGKDAAAAFVDSGNLIVDVWKDRVPDAAKKGADSIQTAKAPIVASAADIAKAAAQAEAALKRIFEAGKKTYEDVAPPAEKFRLEVQKLTEQYNAGAISAETYARAVDKIKWPSLTQAISDAGNLQKMMDSFSTTSLNSTADALTDIVTGAKDAKQAFADLAKSVIRDLVQMIIKSILFKSIVAPLFGFSEGGSLGFGSGGVLGFAGGGSFQVGGGLSAVDNQMLPIKVASGERVDITPADKAGSHNPPTVMLSMKPGRYTRDEVKGILDVANELFSDGYKLKHA